MTHIVLRPAAKTSAAPYRFFVLLEGEPIRKHAYRVPFFDAARKLLKMGFPAADELTASHEGSATIAMRMILGEAARWTVQETDKGGLRKMLWQPFPADFGKVEEDDLDR